MLQRITPSAADPNELREKLNVRRLGRTKLTLSFSAPSSAVFEKRKASQYQAQSTANFVCRINICFGGDKNSFKIIIS